MCLARSGLVLSSLLARYLCFAAGGWAVCKFLLAMIDDGGLARVKEGGAALPDDGGTLLLRGARGASAADASKKQLCGAGASD